MDNDDVVFKRNPQIKANPISNLFFCWLFPLLKSGNRNGVNVSDLYSSLPEDSSGKLGNFVERKWKEELKLSKEKSRPPKLWRVMRAMIWKRYLFIGIFCCIDELVIRVFQPIILKNFIRTFRDSPENEYENHRRDQYLLAGGLVLVSFAHAIFFQSIITACLHIGLKVRLGVSSLLFRKILRLQKADSEQANVGKLCNLLASDVGRFDQGFQLLHFLYIAPIQVLIYSYLLWKELGPASMGGIGCILFILPMQLLVGRFSLYFRIRIARRTDERGRFLNEIIGGIRLIKMYAWEKPFSSIVSKLRRAEVKFIRRHLYLRGMYVCVHIIAGKFIPFCALIVYVAFGNELVADKAFFTVSIFAILQAVLNRIPNGSSYLGEMIASANRIEQFLLSKENNNDAANNLESCDFAEASKTRKHENGYVEPSVFMDNYSAGWSEEHVTLKDLNVNLKGNKLVMVVGHVGSGKSSFLNAILKELPVSSNTCHVQGRLTYASQEAWIFPGTLRQNVLFGLDMNLERYWKVIELTCLDKDIKGFPDGDLTLVGEKGISLSGGQKARLNLARALYQEADIYLLDDPLSAVDTHTNRYLFEKCIKEHLNGKLRILATHQLQYLKMANHIIVLNRDGEIWCQGNYEELKNNGVDFTSLISEKFMKQQIEVEGEEDKNENEDDKESQASSEKNSMAEERNDLLTGNPVNRMKEEHREKGSITLSSYISYFKSGGSYFTMFILVVAFLSCHVIIICLDYWLSRWTNAASKSENKTEIEISWLRNLTFMNSDGDDGEGDGLSQDDIYAYTYCGLMGLFIAVTIFRSFLFFRYCMAISLRIHDDMFSKIVRAPTKFYDDNPSGRIMNRFTKDLNHIDESLPLSFFDYVTVVFTMFGMLILNIVANYYVAIPAVVLLFGLWRIRKFYLNTSRDLKRLESIMKSPMFTHVTLTVQGLTTIRALKAEDRILNQFDKIQDRHTSVFYLLFTSNRWFAVWLEIMTNTFLTSVCFGFLLLPLPFESGSVGVALSSILALAGTLQWGIRQSAETENYMTSVERALEYCNLKPEASLESPEDSKIQPGWPEKGRIDFKSVSLAYDDLQENKVLHDISFSTNPQEKVGVVGRTGAGKSSLITALFRLTELCEGEILIDDVAIKDIGLHTLRSRISIIPQDPVLFTGSLRYNLDPFNEFQDNDLWRVLEEVDLHQAVQDHSGLDTPVSDGGSNFSVGQRQLLCLARAALRKNRIIVLDEITAHCDPATDQLVQNTIRKKFSDCTILTIAHRLQSVLDNDRILVLNMGRIEEFDSPDILMQNEAGAFSSLLHQSVVKEPNQ